MSLKGEFLAGFQCEAPDGLPVYLQARLGFISCLMSKEHRSVYQVIDRETRGKAVLKISLPGNSNNIKREYELLTKLEHPCIPRALHYEVDAAGREYFLRDYAEGDTLFSLLERDGVFSERQTLEIAGKLCKILSYLHRQSPPVIYRDISPRNIVLTPNGKLSLIDFGISREERPDASFDTVYVGNAAFASPEQFGFTRTDPRSDIFALGKLMIYLSVGDADLPGFMKRADMSALRKITSKCTQLSPEKRYASVEKLNKAIERILRPPTRRELLTAGVCATCVLIGGLCVWSGTRNSAPAALPVSSPVAVGEEAKDEVKIPVLIETTMNGEPFSDCAVAVDNHHWYQPAANGQAELLAYAYSNYKVRAAAGNQVAAREAVITRDGGPYAFAFDMAELPVAPEYMALEVAFGQRTEVRLDIAQADEVILTDAPNGISIVKLDDGFALIVDVGMELPGHYLIFMESTNAQGKADTALSIRLMEEKSVISIRTAQDMDRIRDNLSGYYRLENDIDLSSYGHWTPIGTADHPFTGTFDGAGHTISGLSMLGSDNNTHYGLFGKAQRAVIRDLILDAPDVQVSHTSNYGVAALVSALDRGRIEDCAVLNGSVNANVGYDESVGGICGLNSGVIVNCFSSARITVADPARSGTDSQSGGICGTNTGYLAACGNAGRIASGSIAGGVAGFSDMGVLTRCFNTGDVVAPTYAGAYPPGGIVHLLGRGKSVSNSRFLKGTASVGTTVWNGGVLLNIVPEDWAVFADLPALCEDLGIDRGGTAFSNVLLDR